MRDLKELNINDGGRPVKRPPPTDADFLFFEQNTGLLVPPDLRCLLMFSNGGGPELDAVGGASGAFSIDTFFHLTSDDFGTESMWYAVKHWRPILGDFALPFGQDGGGNQFFLDLSVDPPRVNLCLHDESMRILNISASFEEFVNSLELDPDMI